MIAILLPNMGQIHATLHDWLRITAEQIEVEEMKTYCVSPLEKAFNTLHAQFLESDCTHAFILNADEMPPVGAIQKLLEHDKDMVSCVAPKWDDKVGPLPVAARFDEQHDYFTYLGGPGLLRVDRCGFSGILIKREVMEKIPVGTFEYTETAKCECDWVDHMAMGKYEVCPECGTPLVENGTYFISPEFKFEDVARELGFEIWVDFDLQMHHFVECDLYAINEQLGRMRARTLAQVLDKVRLLRGECTDTEIVEALLAQGGKHGSETG